MYRHLKRSSLKRNSRYFSVKQKYVYVALGLFLSLLVVLHVSGPRTTSLRWEKLNSDTKNEVLVSSLVHTRNKSSKHSRLSDVTDHALTAAAKGHAQTSYSTMYVRTSAVIILTYMRSGSSLTGDILQRAPGSFYLYEPLCYLGGAWKAKKKLTFVNGTIRQWPYSFLSEGVNIIRHWLNCDVTKIYENGLKHHFMDRGRTSNGFKNCVAKQNSLGRNGSTSINCALELKATCKQSTIVIIKTIRMPLSAISHLLEEIPGLKIIHLVRDQRATLLSHRWVGICSPKEGGKAGCTNKYCTRLENDILERENLTRRYPNRVKTLLYEDLARKPIETSKSLFNFIGAAFDAETEEFIFNKTLAGNAADCVICTTRPNSTALIDAWKKNIQSQLGFLTMIEQRCNYVLRYFNYTLLFNTSRIDIDTMYHKI